MPRWTFWRKKAWGTFGASGVIPKIEVLNGNIGILYKKDTWRIRKDKTKFQFNEDTYEIDFKDISSPWLTHGFFTNSLLIKKIKKDDVFLRYLYLT